MKNLQSECNIAYISSSEVSVVYAFQIISRALRVVKQPLSVLQSKGGNERSELRQSHATGEQSFEFGGFSKKLPKFLQVVVV